MKMVCGDCKVNGKTESQEDDAHSKDDEKNRGDELITSGIVLEDRGHFHGASAPLPQVVTPEFPGIQENVSPTNPVGSTSTTATRFGNIRGLTTLRKNQRGVLPFLMTLTSSILMLYIGQIAVLIWMTARIMKMPHTFAWKALVSSMGCFYNSKLNTASVPSFPIIQAIISVLMILATLTYLATSKETFLLPVKIVTWMQLVFSIPVGLISYAKWSNHNSLLHETMSFAMLSLSSSSLPSFYPLPWDITQETGQCCGVDSPNDWNRIRTRYPSSCFVFSHFEHLDIWPTGCYQQEARTLWTNGILLLVSISVGTILAGAQLCILIYCNEFSFFKNMDKLQPISAHTLIFRQGSSCLSLSINEKGTVLQLQGSLLEANGALGSNIVILENQATIHIKDFVRNEDRIKIERKAAKIEIFVERNEKPRGTCTITTTDLPHIADVKVEDTSNGTVKVLLPPSLI